MRVAVLGVQTPFAAGGAELLVRELREQVARAGHVVEVVTLPFNDVDRSSFLSSCAAWRGSNLVELPDGPIDVVIATKFPSYWVRHPNKVVWLVHQYRGAYDFAGTSYTNLRPDRLPDTAVRESLLEMDRSAFAECAGVFTISRTVTDRLRLYNGVESRPLYHPSRLAGRVAPSGYGDFVLAVSRLERNKRLPLLLESLLRTTSGVRAVIVGSGSQEAHLRFLVEQYGLSDRVTIEGAVGDDRLVELYGSCRAVFFAPFEEDYGYVTLEAFGAAKPVVTTGDSGGVLEFVEDGVTGVVGKPTPEDLAPLLDRLANDEALARRLGEAGRERVRPITWDGVVEALLAVADAGRFR